MQLDATEIEVNGTTYVPKGSNQQAPSGNLSLVILDKGFIFVGEVEEEKDVGLHIRNCWNVRKWSQGGFGGLTQGAKTSGATLDKCRDLTAYFQSVHSITPLAEGWHEA